MNDHEQNPQDNGPPEPKRDRERFNICRELFDWGQALMYALIFMMVGLAFFARLLSVSGDSMRDTLYDGEYMLIGSQFAEPRSGDIVIIIKNDFLVYNAATGRSSAEPLVKRVVAVAGQTVTVDYAAGRILVDGIAFDEPLTIRGPTSQASIREVTYPYVVPEGHVFVVGDNRNSSSDSRSFGSVDRRMIVGRLLLRLTPFRKFGPVA
jgi:signal peptidase I